MSQMPEVLLFGRDINVQRKSLFQCLSHCVLLLSGGCVHRSLSAVQGSSSCALFQIKQSYCLLAYNFFLLK